MKMPPEQLTLRLHEAVPGRVKEWGGLSKDVCASPAPSSRAPRWGAAGSLCPAGC